jgi:starvation-inducible DNA-binding protein
MAKPYSSKMAIPKKQRDAMAAVLNARLADAIDLTLAGKQAHWNVKGPNFIALHELFDKLVEDSEGWVDDLAERAVALGGTAQGTTQAVAKRTSLKPYPSNITAGAEHLVALAGVLAAFGKNIRAAIEVADELDDDVTEDLFIRIASEADKYLWFIEAHLQ